MIAAMPLEIWDARYFTTEQARSIGELIHQTWLKPHLTADDRAAQQLALGRQYSEAAEHGPLAMVIVEQGRVVAHASVQPRTLRTQRGKMTVGGLARVCTAADRRGAGLGEAVVRAAFELVDRGAFPFLLFQASQRVQAFYEKLGAVGVLNRVVNSLADDPTASAFWDDLVLRYPAGGEWPPGVIDLQGPGY
ncbi:MAG: GNAT family N-acetyltransferase [Pirellulales bacterium]|nr:GNAT family N-acetyltransferase [Pirellulales bacterium]